MQCRKTNSIIYSDFPLGFSFALLESRGKCLPGVCLTNCLSGCRCGKKRLRITKMCHAFAFVLLGRETDRGALLHVVSRAVACHTSIICCNTCVLSFSFANYATTITTLPLVLHNLKRHAYACPDDGISNRCYDVMLFPKK